MSMILKRVSTLNGARRMMSSAAGGHDGIKMWKNLSLYMAIPCVIVMSAYNFMHMAQDGPHERPEFVPYDHLRLRTKRFPWGDGNKSLFHNPHVNALPAGYEDDHH